MPIPHGSGQVVKLRVRASAVDRGAYAQAREPVGDIGMVPSPARTQRGHADGVGLLSTGSMRRRAGHDSKVRWFVLERGFVGERLEWPHTLIVVKFDPRTYGRGSRAT